MQNLATVEDLIPLETGRDGVVRVGGTRVTLDSVVDAFQEGLTAEEILDEYPSLSLADVYAVIGYYLRHRGEVEEYIAAQQRRSAEVRLQDEARYDKRGIRERMLARRSAQ